MESPQNKDELREEEVKDSSNEEEDEEPKDKRSKRKSENEEEEDYEPEQENEEAEEEIVESDDEPDNNNSKSETARQTKIRKLKEEEEEQNSESGSEGEESSESEEEGEPQETESDALKLLRSSLHFATVLHFLDLFREAFSLDDKDVKQQKRSAPPPSSSSSKTPPNSLKPKKFKYSAEKLETSLSRCRSSRIAPDADKGFLIELHIRLMRAVNPKRRPPPNFDTWENNLKNMINREQNAPASAISVGANELNFNNSTFDENPLESSRYFLLPVLVKVSILKALTEWILDYNDKLGEHIGDFQPSELDDTIREEPLGIDSKGFTYWCLDVNDVTPRIYREKSKPSWGPNNRLIPPAWETVTTSIPEVEQLIEDFETKTSSADQRILKDLKDGVLPALIEEEKKKERIAKKLAKQEVSGVSMRNIIFSERPRRTRKEVNYNYDVKDTDLE